MNALAILCTKEGPLDTAAGICLESRGYDVVRSPIGQTALRRAHSTDGLFESDGPLAAFEWFARALGEIEPVKLRGATVIVDRTAIPWALSIDCWKPINSNGLDAGIALAILAFPEVHWVFLSGRVGKVVETWQEWHECVSERDFGLPLSDPWRRLDALFDPTGLRQSVRSAFNSQFGASRTELGIRTAVSAALDEEDSYRQLVGYAMWKGGYRVAVPRSAGGAKIVQQLMDTPGGVSTVIEDYSLEFPDLPGEAVQSLRDRDDRWRWLKRVVNRVFLTGGALSQLDRTYLTERQAADPKIRPASVMVKPVARLADFSRWKVPQAKSHCEIVGESQGHAAPGIVVRVSEILVARSRALLQGPLGVDSAVQAAVCAREAAELLAGQTPTLSYEAIALAHEAETVLEGQCLGVGVAVDAERRLEEIEREVAAASRSVAGKRRERSRLEATARIADRLVSRFREAGRIEEELATLAAARQLRLELLARRSSAAAFWYPLLRLSNAALGSLRVFAGVLAAWVVAFGIVYFVLAGDASMAGALSAFVNSASFTLTLEPPPLSSVTGDGPNTVWLLVLTLQGVGSLLLVGILVAHLYLVLSRR